MSRSLPTSADFRELLALAVPVAVVQLGLMAMGVVDTMVVGRISPVALAGVAIGNVYTYATAMFGMGLLAALDPVVSQAVGARDEPAIHRAVQRGLVIAGGLGAFGALAILPIDPVLRALGQPAEVVAVATPFARAMMPSMIGFFVFLVFRQTLQAHGRLRPIVMTIVVANALNALLVWMLVFGEWGAPRLGAVGAGWATSVVRLAMPLLLLAFAWRDLRPWLAWLPNAVRLAPIRRMLAIGLPIAIQYELEYGIFATVAVLMGRLGAVPMSAHQIAINVASFTFMVPFGVSAAAAVLVGRAVGAGDPLAARRAGLASLAVGAGFMALSALALAVWPVAIARAYTPDISVIAMTAMLIPIAGVFQVFDGIQVVAIGVLRGFGDTRTPLIVSLVGYWGVALPVSAWLGFSHGLGPRGLWWGLVAGLAIVALVLLARVRYGLWRPMRRLVVDEMVPATER